MKAMLVAAAVLVVAGVFSPAARAEMGPRPSSENNWPGMMNAAPPTQAAAAAPPHYVWQEGYVHGGKWRGHWVLVQ